MSNHQYSMLPLSLHTHVHEIDTEHKEKYYNSLLKRADSGFIIWQTICFDIEYMNQIIQTPKEIIIEKPQTCFETRKPNYFLFF